MKRLVVAGLVMLLCAALAPVTEEWVCPMPEHTKVFDKAGSCIECGMALVRKEDRDKQLKIGADAAAGKGLGADLKPPAKGKILVAFVMSEGATMIDFAGPWEVFQDVYLPGRGMSMDDARPFRLFTVAETRQPIHTSGGMTIVPDSTFDDAPTPRVIIVPAQSTHSEKALRWLRDMRPKVDVLASVCTGAFLVARAGLLDGKEATTHHDYYDAFAVRNPKVRVVRGRRYVQADRVIATAGGLSSGIDLALHIVERYFGRDTAESTARMMEYSGTGWKAPVATAQR